MHAQPSQLLCLQGSTAQGSDEKIENGYLQLPLPSLHPLNGCQSPLSQLRNHCSQSAVQMSVQNATRNILRVYVMRGVNACLLGR